MLTEKQEDILESVLSYLESNSIPEVQQVGGLITTPSVSFIRPNNTTMYAKGDVVSNATSGNKVLTFEGCARTPGGTGWIQNALLIDGSNETTKLAADLWLFSKVVDIEGDNAKWTPEDTELLLLQAVIQWNIADTIQSDVTANIAGNVVNQQSNLAKPFKCSRESINLFGVLTARNIYTPVALEPFSIILNILQD